MSKVLTKDQVRKSLEAMEAAAAKGDRPTPEEAAEMKALLEITFWDDQVGLATNYFQRIPKTNEQLASEFKSKKKFPRCEPCSNIKNLHVPSEGVHPSVPLLTNGASYPPGYRTDYVTHGTKKMKHVTMFLCHETATNQSAESSAEQWSGRIAYNIELAMKNNKNKRRGRGGWQTEWNRSEDSPNPSGEGVKYGWQKGYYKAGSKKPVWTDAQLAEKRRLSEIKKANKKKKSEKTWDEAAKAVYKKAATDLKALRKEVKRDATEWTYTYVNPGHNVHFWNGRDGQVWQGAVLDEATWHGSYAMNFHSVGMETCNPSWASRRGKNNFKKWLATPYPNKIMNNAGNVGKNMLPKSQVGSGGLHFPGFKEVLPGEIQCRRAWEVILFLMSPDNPFSKIYHIPLAFPGTFNAGIFNGLSQNSIQLGTGFVSGMGNQQPIFIWRRMKGTSGRQRRRTGMEVESINGGGALRWWKRGINSNVNKPPKNHWHHGILSHMRWETHTDGQNIEYYCLGRALGLSSANAYYAMIGAMATVHLKKHTPPGWNRKYPLLPTGYTYFPDSVGYFYIKFGKKLFGSGPLNWYQTGSDYVKGKKLYTKTYKWAKDTRSHRPSKQLGSRRT